MDSLSQVSNDDMPEPTSAEDTPLPAAYRPSDDEPFMGPLHQTYFRKKLIDWRDQLAHDVQDTLDELKADSLKEADMADRASSEEGWGLHMRKRDRQRKLTAKIDAALRRLEHGEYGFCEVTGEPISLKRLDARPIATMTVDAQEAHERAEKISRDR